MDPRYQEALVQRLIGNPHDQAAISEAHSAGQTDPEGYARLLEKVGLGSPDPTLAAHWLNEAANVWITTFNDPERAASVLMAAVERDPIAEGPAQRLTQLYRGTGDAKALASSYERRANALAQRSRQDPSVRTLAAHLYEEVARLYAEPPIGDAARSRECFAKAIALDPSNQLAIYTLREAYKAAGEPAKALTYFAPEQALEANPARKLALFRDEAEVAKAAGDRGHAVAALRNARLLDPNDGTLKAQAASLVLELHRLGTRPADEERGEGGRLFVELSEAYPGEHGFLYALCALELIPSDDRAMQLAIYYGEQLHRLAEVAPLAAGYLALNPGGVMAAQARLVAGDARPPLPPPPAAASVRPPTTGHPPDGSVARVLPGQDSVARFAHEAEHDNVDDLLEQADAMARKSRKNEAIATYRRVLVLEPTNADALGYLMEQLPLKRKYAELRDVLLGAVTAQDATDSDRVRWLREVADLCENQLRDYDGAVQAWQRIAMLEPGAPGTIDHLRRLLERARRWDELADILAAEAARTEDLEVRISLERNLAKLHSGQRNDPVSAGHAWARIAELATGDDDALNEAVRLFESAGRLDFAAAAIAKNVEAVDDPSAQRELYHKLGQVYADSSNPLAAAEALSEGASELNDAEMWGRAEHYFVVAGAWEQAANAADEQARLASDQTQQAELFARAANYFERFGENEEAVTRLERAVEYAPTHEEYAVSLERLLVAAGRVGELAALFTARADKLEAPDARVGLRKRAAKLQQEHLGDVAAARASYVMVLRDAEDLGALAWLADEAERRADLENAADYLARLGKAAPAPQKVEHLLREAQLRARGLSDPAGAIQRLHAILEDIDPNNQAVMSDIADLEQNLGHYAEAAQILERQLGVTETREDKLEIALRLADLYEHKLSQPKDAARLLRIVHDTDPDDLDATQRLCDLAQANGEWAMVAELMVELVAVEGDDEEVSRMTQHLASILHEKLGNGAEALNVLGSVADSGDEACRDAYIELGDRLGEKATVARRIVAWHANQPPSPARADALQAAFSRFVDSSMNVEAIAVAKDLAQSNSADLELAPILERIATEVRDLEGLSVAHTLLAADLTGQERGREFVRQAEVLARLEVPADEAIEHGEQALSSVEATEIEPLLSRLAALTTEASKKIDIYERQVGRCKLAEDRVNALCRAAEVAADLEDVERAQGFFQLALTGVVSDEGLERIVELVRRADARSKTTALRSILAESLANGGQGARDGGRTQSRMLCRAAELAYAELANRDQALTWSGDALIQYVDEVTLAALHGLAARLGDYRAAETVVSRALEEVFDGPMVRQLLAYRAELRSAQLGDRVGAAADLKRLHDLLPGDAEVATRLATLYEELLDYRGIIQLYEDQILRSRDQELRAALARKIALLWQDMVGEHREAADAWRRVLRLQAGDEEAKLGLARAKEGMLSARNSAPVSVNSPPPSTFTPVGDDVASEGSGGEQAAAVSAVDDGPQAPTEASVEELAASFGPTDEEDEARGPVTHESPVDAAAVDADGLLDDSGEEGASDTLELDVEEEDLAPVPEVPSPASPPPSRSLPPPPGAFAVPPEEAPNAPAPESTPPARRPRPPRRGGARSERED